MAITLTDRVFNFSAGPATIPEPVLQTIREELMSLPGVGASVMEISHRSPAFVEIIEDASNRIRDLMSVPVDYEVIFLQGGATLQNTMIPANLLVNSESTADYILTGSWGTKSSKDVSFYGKLNIAYDGSGNEFRSVPKSDELRLTPGAAYAHITSNETIQGVQFREPPETDAPIAVDQSSDFLSRPIDVTQYGLIYACAQKNCGIAGVTVVVIRKDLLERSKGRLPRYLDYAQHVAGKSMLNTPPTFPVYVTGLVCKWLQNEIGGLAEMESRNSKKANLLYQAIDQSSGYYQGHADADSRSLMNVCFRLPTPELEKQFVNDAANQGLATLGGHRSVGGIRASIYNAMPLKGVEALTQFMSDFADKNG